MISFTYKFQAPDMKALQKRIELGLARGLNEGGDKVRTQVQRALKVDMGVNKYGIITTRMNESGRGYNSAKPGRQVYVIMGRGGGLPIYDFPVKATRSGVDARPWGVARVFQRSFAIKGKGDKGFRARIPAQADQPDFVISKKTGKKVWLKGRFPIRTLYGPGIPKEMMSGPVVAVFRKSAEAFVPPAVLKNLLRSIG